MNSNLQIDVLADYDCLCGENPLWHPDEKRVYWTDIDSGRLFWFDPATGKSEQCFDMPKRKVGGFTIQPDGKLLLFMDRGTIATWDGKTLTPIVEEIERERESRFNDVIADPEGRVFCGTMSSSAGKGVLYRLEHDASYTIVAEDVGCSNGMGFTLDLTRMYYTDSWPREIYVYDYDRASGKISNRKILVSRPDAKDTCDGMTVDADGNLWSAWWGAGFVRQFTPEGTQLQEIKLPASRISSCTFGGPNLDELYLTTAVADKKVENDGALLRIRGLGVKGRPEFRSRISV